MFCHYINNPVVTEKWLHGDAHQENADALGIGRKKAKNVYYAFLYGAQDKKLGSTGGGFSAYWGKKARATLIGNAPGLDRLIAHVTDEYRRGFIECLDGGFVRCPSPHAALNYKFQSAGAVVMKLTSVILDRHIKEKGLDVLKVGDIHDEGQLDVLPSDAEEAGKLAIQSHIEAGEELNLRVPLSGACKIGPNWASTH
jgi:DNA polymerase I-like protein with 3'-5' exonuclease and polymerase domains